MVLYDGDVVVGGGIVARLSVSRALDRQAAALRLRAGPRRAGRGEQHRRDVDGVGRHRVRPGERDDGRALVERDLEGEAERAR